MWHELYDDPSSVLSARLRLVQAQLSDALDHAPGRGGPAAEPLRRAGARRDRRPAHASPPGRRVRGPDRGQRGERGDGPQERRRSRAGRRSRCDRRTPAGPAATPTLCPPTCCCCAGSSGTSATPISSGRSRGPGPLCPRCHRHLDPASPPAGPHAPGASLVPGGRLCGSLVQLTRECTEDSGRRRTAASRGSQRPRRRRFAGRPGRPGKRGGTARRATVHFPFEDARSAPGMSSACWIRHDLAEPAAIEERWRPGPTLRSAWAGVRPQPSPGARRPGRRAGRTWASDRWAGRYS